mgnify:CR=1 FL=1
MTHLWVRAEQRPNEERVGLTPDGAAALVKAGIRQPEEILLLAFAKNAAEEMSERVEARSGVPIVARTFHAIAYDIIGIVEGSKPALADHATDDMAFSNLIKQILKDLVYRLSEVSKAIIQQSRRSFLVADHSKLDRSAPARLASLAEVTVLFTDRELPQDLARKCAEWGTEVVVAPAEAFADINRANNTWKSVPKPIS